MTLWKLLAVLLILYMRLLRWQLMSFHYFDVIVMILFSSLSIFIVQTEQLRDFCDFFVYFLLEFNLPTYSITPSAHPAKCPPPSARHPVTPSPRPPPLPLPLVCFPELGVSHVLSRDFCDFAGIQYSSFLLLEPFNRWN